MQLSNAAGFNLRHITSSSGLTLSVLPNAQIYCIEHRDIQISQIRSSPVAGGLQRLYLRKFTPKGIEFVEIIGPKSVSQFAATVQSFTWSGQWDEFEFNVTCQLHPSESVWFFVVQVKNIGRSATRCDVVLLQDLGLAGAGQVRNNELFTSQYIDHCVHTDPNSGYVVMSRQNLAQGDVHPWLMQGCLEGCQGFTTDGFDFFGAGYKVTGIPVGLAKKSIGNTVRQYETACIAMQSNPITLSTSEQTQWTYFAAYAHHPAESSVADLKLLTHIRSLAAEIRSSSTTPALVSEPDKSLFQTTEMFPSDDLSTNEIDRRFPDKHRHVEIIDGALQSFFYGDDARHVVLKVKEAVSERPHGHVLRSGEGFTPAAHLMSVTLYAAGVFGSQLAVGHTAIGKLLSGSRDPLNIIRSSGLRIFVRSSTESAWQLLGMPSAFEMSPSDAIWHYVNNAADITIRCSTSSADAALTYEIRSSGAQREFLICGEVCAGPNEYEETSGLKIDSENHRVSFQSASGLLAAKEPARSFHIVSSTPGAIARLDADGLLFADAVSRGLPYVTIQTQATQHFVFTIVSAREGASELANLCKRYESPTPPTSRQSMWRSVTAEMQLNAPSPHAAAMTDALRWFAHNAMIHLSVPRGLEQANGGAWGVRDVCQGPVEFLLSYGHDEVVADILRTLFSQQYAERHDWPQWFSFAPFEEFQSPHCHGDVLIWPLKALCDYLEESDNRALLGESLPYTDEKTFRRTEHRETILQHIDRLLNKVESSFLPGTSLPRYGDGDWDDSLQPADPRLRDHMVSSWTTELLYQTLSRWAKILEHFDMRDRAERAADLASGVRGDFQRYLIQDQVVAGFALFEGTNRTALLLHPDDEKTGLRYRLIPMTRGIISQIFTPEQAISHMRLIKQHLLFPDGARLMDRPTEYHGGLETVFRRSESASFFGREIGLQYVHAHLRYAEALAGMGRADELMQALLAVNPITVTDVVRNANPRQRNTFFSSSDAAFTTRYDATKRYAELKLGNVQVNGGWRVYSSGPGIYSNLVVRHLFGIRRYLDWVEFDPVVPPDWNGTELTLCRNSRQIKHVFRHGQGRGLRVNGMAINEIADMPHPYRKGGIRVSRANFEPLLSTSGNVVEISC